MKVPDDDEFSDGLDEFEESMEEHKKKGPPLKNQTTYANKPYDEAIEVSQDLSMVENSMDFRSGQVRFILILIKCCNFYTLFSPTAPSTKRKNAEKRSI